MTARLSILRAPALAALALACVCSTAHADRWDDALALVPPNAQSVLVIPSPKQASDDLQQALERMGRAEVALGGRPIDLLRARLGIGAGFDDKGMLVAWTLAGPEGTQLCMLVPVTDADAFKASSLVDAGAPAYQFAGGGPQLYPRTVGSHVLLTTSETITSGYAAAPRRFAASLASRLGARGQTISRSGDLLVWAGHGAFEGFAAEMLATAKLAAEAVASGADADMPPEVRAIMGDSAQLQAQMERSAAIAKQVSDAVITVDFDALGVGLRSFVRLEPGSELAKAIPASATLEPAATGSQAAAPAAPSAAAPSAAAPAAAPAAALVNALPNAPFYLAGGLNIKGMNGLAGMRALLAALPMGEQLPLPAWLDSVQGKIDAVQVALYPSKLSVLAGGLGNDSAFFIRTSDPAAVKGALQHWVTSQQGERNGVQAEATWEVARVLRDGSKADAFAVKETVVDLNAAGGTVSRLTKQIVVGSRGLHGFVAEVPGGLVVTLSQRPDVIERATLAASQPAGSLGAQGMITSYAPWLMNDPDAVVFVGLGEVMRALQQVASAMPGGAADVLPVPTTPVEPIAAAVRGRDGAWEGALVLPSTALAVGFDVAMLQLMAGQRGADAP